MGAVRQRGCSSPAPVTPRAGTEHLGVRRRHGPAGGDGASLDHDDRGRRVRRGGLHRRDRARRGPGRRAGAGWAVAFKMLENERGPTPCAAPRCSAAGLRRLLEDGAAPAGRLEDHLRRVVDAVTSWPARLRAAPIARLLDSGAALGAESTLTKVALTEAEQLMFSVAHEVLGMGGVAWAVTSLKRSSCTSTPGRLDLRRVGPDPAQHPGRALSRSATRTWRRAEPAVGGPPSVP